MENTHRAGSVASSPGVHTLSMATSKPPTSGYWTWIVEMFTAASLGPWGQVSASWTREARRTARAYWLRLPPRPSDLFHPSTVGLQLRFQSRTELHS